MATASAVFRGSRGSRGGGAREVDTEQNLGAVVLVVKVDLQPLVQVSPMSMMVAVAVPFSPPQHSPMLGHLASSQTVASPRPRT